MAAQQHSRLVVGELHSLGGPRAETSVWFQSVLLQMLVLPFNPCHFIQGSLAAPENFSGLTEEVVRPKRRLGEGNTGCCDQCTPVARRIHTGCALCAPYTHQHWCNTSLCRAEPVPSPIPFVLVPRALSPSISHSEATAQPDGSTAAFLQLSLSHHELGALWSALSVLW